MAYARFGENSDVYVYKHISGYIECCNCVLTGRYHTTKELKEIKSSYKELPHQDLISKLDFNNICFLKTDRQSITFKTIDDVLNHLYQHEKAGHKVEKYTIKRLKEENKKDKK